MPKEFKNAGKAVLGTGDSTLYTCSASTQAVVHAIYLANVDGAAEVTVDVKWTDSSAGQTFYLLYQVPIPVGSTFVFDKPVNLEENDIILARAGADNDVVATLAILEIT